MYTRKYNSYRTSGARRKKIKLGCSECKHCTPCLGSLEIYCKSKERFQREYGSKPCTRFVQN